MHQSCTENMTTNAAQKSFCPMMLSSIILAAILLAPPDTVSAAISNDCSVNLQDVGCVLSIAFRYSSRSQLLFMQTPAGIATTITNAFHFLVKTSRVSVTIAQVALHVTKGYANRKQQYDASIQPGL
jgi:hypothetical protein